MQSNFLIFLFCFLFSVFLFFFLMQKSTAKRAYRSATKREPHPFLYHSASALLRQLLLIAVESCVCVCRLIKATAAATTTPAAAAVTQLDQLIGRLLRMPPKGWSATEHKRTTRERKTKKKNKQTIELMKRSTNREMTNILLQVHALQLMRITVN